MSKSSKLKNNTVSLYPERNIPHESWLDRTGVVLAGHVIRKFYNRSSRFAMIVPLAAKHKDRLEGFNDEQITEYRNDVRMKLLRRGIGDVEAVAESFALIREVSRRILGMAHYDVQLIGGFIMLNGLIAEMQTGEGKTLTATLPTATAALAGMPVHVITVNDYLAERDAETMQPVYEALGLTVSTVVEGMSLDDRQRAYACDITYCTNKELAFDYLKDRLVMKGHTSDAKLKLERLYGSHTRVHHLLLRGLHFALIDEADSVLIDEAKTPLIISETKEDDEEQKIYQQALSIIEEFSDDDYALQRKDRQIRLSDRGKEKAKELAEPYGGIWMGKKRREELIKQALSAVHLFEKDKHYLIRDDKVQIIDEYTGRIMADRSWERGLHQLIETKEGVETTGRRDTLARVSYQRFFRKYLMVSGMTGTAREVENELWAIYRLHVVPVPTNRPPQRINMPTRIFTRVDDKYLAIMKSVKELSKKGRPVLIGARTVEASEALSKVLHENGVQHQVLNARQDEQEADIVSTAGEYGKVTVATNMAGRGTDIKLVQEVSDLGGLHVIVTELHEAKRIDRQLIGRCGRQGDKGSYEKILSFEDELAKMFIPAFLRQMATKWLASDKESLRKLADRILHSCQRRAERQHTRTRYDLLKSDQALDKKLAFTGKG